MHLRLFAAAGIALALLSGCSDDEPSHPSGTGAGGGGGGGAGGPSGGGGSGGCEVLDVSLTQIYRYTDAYFSVQAQVSPETQGAYRTLAVLEMYSNGWPSPDLPPLETGTFDLGDAPNDRYETCQHCVTVITPDASEVPTRTFFQKSGSIELTKLHAFYPSIAVGKVTDVTLAEVEMNDDGTWETVPGGACFTIPSWSFDTRPVNGIPCEKAEDCGNTTMQVCSPDTKKCSDYECLMTFDLLCPEGELCLTQAPGEVSIGACYKQCTPFTSGDCGAKEACVALDPVQQVGVCRPLGDGELGEACDEPDVSTGCEAGALCAGVPATCEKVCSYLTKHPGCPDGRLCGLHNVCLPPESGDPAAIGGACQAGWVPYRDCGADDEAFRGLCMSLYPEETVEHCQRTCRTAGDDCPSGDYCASIFDNNNIGICWKIPVCGDGELDPLNEVCDDGNDASGDGCAGDCDAAEFDVLCGAAEPLVLDADITGTTKGGPTGYGGSCELYIVVPSKTFTFDVPGPGRLSLRLDSNKNLDLLVVGDCADPHGTEIACQSSPDKPEVLELDFDTTPSGPVMIVVRGNTIPDVGAFTLRASFTPAVCGDGVAVGPEVCDDGNTISGDGCSGDCLTIEWPEVCAGLPTLSTTSPNTGNTATAPNLNNTDGNCTAWSGSGGEVMYRYVAPNAGTLTLHVDETDADLALYVTDGCDAATEATLLACSNGGFPPAGYEELSVNLAAGQLVTVVADTFFAGSGGPFSLTATFQ
jgi:cysteine-rich repeat protein